MGPVPLPQPGVGLANNSQSYLNAVGFQEAVSGDAELEHGQGTWHTA